ncbi:MAG: TIGR04283 family arsenosugar biosynthesis glycosyltransferase [gamma proteobacterium symbiont of Bathyaustriella thionipta]|nr:TIGR04283 family arsenosugar biosynthesis glycosyltransferase [gamma proteobacterium symbiont of Bathyaustriella thionipta]MCU7950932.1 TIGR04283 family arsenosugar biosynthesis glycosyltransferase [gamma proteobacterium symbiont of Bathyaustriella thionipta]MCU7952743.1 TIGR04283 family arsenosugar biosynthesis glycosyltransferase [gamma proteobacterium symbiont of Bathyaustriella thionipta]MCU7957423.1 TIGR04283 family arsenosugar biosynthesis glycosyltransferase [gamma proteobacterium symb
MWQKISIIIPTLNEAESIQVFLEKLQPLREHGHEVVLVDGQSKDATCALARPLVDRMLSSPCGRARQQLLGTKMATGEVFLFLHADTELPEQADQIILLALARGFFWGRFNVRLSGSHWLFRLIEKMMNWRSCITGIATGDQSIFVSKILYNDVGGIPSIELMEDIEFSKRLRKQCKPACLKSTVVTSSKRWKKNGILRTVFFMWSMRLQYFFGVKTAHLVKKYYP